MNGQDLGQGQGHLHLLFEGIIIKAHNLLEDHVLFMEIKKHIARFCPDRTKSNNMKIAAARTGGRGRSISLETCTFSGSETRRGTERWQEIR